jgi:hypothetical protein
MPTAPDIVTNSATQPVGDTCYMCPHLRTAHDVISTRYCAATEAGALTRGCVCPPDK